MIRYHRAALVCATAFTAWTAHAEPVAPASPPALEDQFRDPPASARPRVWWHWMNGNISKDGIAKDLAWMQRIGIGGVQNFDVALDTPQIVDKRLVYMTPEWQEAFRFAAHEADRLGLELAIASSPGWSETGGPWVAPQDGIKKLVWSETELAGGKRFAGKLPSPPSVVGPYGTIPYSNPLEKADERTAPAPFYADVAVFAVPITAPRLPLPTSVSGTDGKLLEGAALGDDDLASGIDLVSVSGQQPMLEFAYAEPQTVRSARLFMPGAATAFSEGAYEPKLEASDDRNTWRAVASFSLTTVPTTIGFAPVRARYFRVRFDAAKKTASPGFAPQVPGVDFGGMLKSLGDLSNALFGKPKRITELSLSAEDRVDRFETKAGFHVSGDYFALPMAIGSNGIAPDKVIDLTAKMASDGTLDWRPPAGRWRVVRLGYSLTGKTNHPAPPEATGLEVDKLDGAAVRRYLDHYLGMYKDAAGADMVGQRGVRALLTDSIEVGGFNWTPRMIEQFKRLRGYDPAPWLPALTGIVVGSRDQSDRFLYDFRRTLADLIASEHYGVVAQVAHENGLKVYGEALESGRPSLGDDMAMRRHADVPMSALWTYPANVGPNPSYVADVKGAASVAHIYGQNLVAAESMTAAFSPWAFGPADLKRVIDLAFVTGVNRPVVHTSVHVPIEDKKPGLSLAVFGQYFNRNESWAELARPWMDYIARNALLLQQGRNVADIAYFYGEEAPLTGLYRTTLVADAPRSVAYDFLNFDALNGALANDGAELVTPGGARYRAIYLGGSSSRMTLAALRKLAALVDGGATIIGKRPIGNPGLTGDAAEFTSLADKLWPATGTGPGGTAVGKGRVIVADSAEAGLAAAGIAPDFHYAGGLADSDIPFVHRKLADGDSYFLANRKNRVETIEARFRVTGKAPELWHAASGTSEPVSYRIEGAETVVPLTLASEESVHVVFRKRASTPVFEVAPVRTVELARIDGPWTVAFEPGRGAPATSILSALAPLNENADSGIKYFSGVATYSRQLTIPTGWKRGTALWLDLGEAREVAEVIVNGRSAGFAWHVPYRVDIGQFAKPGRNRLEVRVANLWTNRMIGDKQPGATPITWAATPTYMPSAPLRRSGLIGPVRLLGAAPAGGK
jgi:hypothetical protein